MMALSVLQSAPRNRNFCSSSTPAVDQDWQARPASEEAEIQRLVLEAYRVLGCRGWGRADLMIRASDRKPFLLEMNTSPGMTSHSLVPMSAKAAGIGYQELCVRLVADATLDHPHGGDA